MSILLKAAVQWNGRFLAQRFDAAAQAPEAEQRSLLQQLLTRHHTTVFGQAHHFAQIHTPEDYRYAVPIQDYEGFRPYINRMMRGEPNLLVNEPVQLFTLTSGTTGQPKYIPVTPSSERGGSNLMRQWLYRALSDHPQFLNRASAGIVSAAVEGYTACGIPYGSVSGRIYQQIPWIVQRSYAIPYPVFELKDYDTRYLAIARFALARQLSFLTTPNPSTLMRLAQVMTTHREGLIRAIHDGTLGFAAEPPLQRRLQARLKPQPQRSRQLEQIVEATDALHPKDCWTDLKLLGCWTGGSVGIQAQRLATEYGNVPVRDLGYIASEARVTLPHQDHTPNGILDLTLNYYEFIPEDKINEPNPPIYLSHELELGKQYSILLTTSAGLYRYHINDIVEVTGFYYQAPILAFVRKGKDMSNLTGEKLHVNHILMAMKQMEQEFDLAVKQYCLVPNLDEMRYHLYLELLEERSDRWIQHTLMPAIERSLAQVNVEYAQKRDSGRLHALCLHLMHPGWAEALQRQAIANGQRDVQYKWKILSPEVPLGDRADILKTFESQPR
ncbi:GH3 auxin-responsive promoter family protein [Leptolyngbya sp. FACHB-541]|uniref:GH3 auxin-responsive promoter family protein n=1 Tax=Leptolyngbya sp. FACHB-541 TaxID=2692810 RepID=UPI001682C026|nr:GH3 auxin-responsive promoter family protein [Leptolyngbya sp. FACHB-541]MBD1997737.1 GH3 auxin-responsive promoter family protein [Leptolyngbya sp. FACHB-541]